MQINHFLEYYFKKDLNYKCNLFHEQYNLEMTQMWDNIRDFIVFHYITQEKILNFGKKQVIQKMVYKIKKCQCGITKCQEKMII